MRLFLLGYMGSGKTTLGVLLAKALNMKFADLDEFIEFHYQKTINELFRENGEEGFRKIESSMLKELADMENVVISTGGGTPCFHDNISFMKQKGTTVYLQSAPSVLAARLNLSKDNRPLIKDKNEEELLEFVSDSLKKREPYYNQADIIFDTSKCENEEDATGLIYRLASILK